jgi:cytochrome P450
MAGRTQFLSDRRWRLGVQRLRTFARALFSRKPLPPGSLAPGTWHKIISDQRHILEKARELGPVFKLLAEHGAIHICVVGHGKARRLFLRNEDRLRGMALDLSRLFPEGFLRVLQAETHRKYRRVFAEAFLAAELPPWLQGRVLDRFRPAEHASAGQCLSSSELREGAREIAADCMLRVLFGVEPGSARSHALKASYSAFGHDPTVRRVRSLQGGAFTAISSLLREMIAELECDSDSADSSVLRHLVDSRCLDATALGNLIYMFVPGHSDLFSLWHWTLKYVAQSPAVVARIRLDAGGDGNRYLAWSEAILLETLRLNQSEALYRAVDADIELDGYLIPKGSVVRACLWEGHKDPQVFADPFAFEPARFYGRSYPADQFAPFGFDKHRCVAADFIVRLSAAFLVPLLRELDFELVADGQPIMGASRHWQPSPELQVRIRWSGSRGSTPARSDFCTLERNGP